MQPGLKVVQAVSLFNLYPVSTLGELAGYRNHLKRVSYMIASNSSIHHPSCEVEVQQHPWPTPCPSGYGCTHSLYVVFSGCCIENGERGCYSALLLSCRLLVTQSIPSPASYFHILTTLSLEAGTIGFYPLLCENTPSCTYFVWSVVFLHGSYLVFLYG